MCSRLSEGVYNPEAQHDIADNGSDLRQMHESRGREGKRHPIIRAYSVCQMWLHQP